MTRRAAAASRAFGGQRIGVSLILDMLASGSTQAEIPQNNPGLSEEDIRTCIAYGSEMARERYVAVALEPTTTGSSSWTKTWVGEAVAC